MKKQDALEVVETLPDEFDPEELMYRLYVLTKIERAETAIEEQGLISDEEIEREIEEWLE
jgi:hypothetical protein